METITIKNLSFTYPESEKAALSEISCTVSRGSFHILCGESGSGKSTLLRHLKPAAAPHGRRMGEIWIEGRRIDELSEREAAEKIGFVSQSPDLQIVCDKVWHELAFGMESLSYPQEEIRARVAEMASFFGIESWFYRDVGTLSGGQKQLLNLAAVMTTEPEILLLDEPTAQLDPIAAQNFLQMLERINRELGTTILLCEHRLEEALPMADRLLLLEKGKLFFDGSPRKLGGVLRDHPMLAAMPAPIRVFTETEAKGECPLTVREGRNWLSAQETVHEALPSCTIPPKREVVLSLSEAWFRYEKDGADILKGFSLSLHRGEMYALIGGNGVGKSTALSVAAGLRKPWRGRVRCDGKAVLLAQNPRDVFSEKTVWAELFSVLGQEAPEEAEKKILQTAAECGLEGLLDRHPYDLSGGEQQRTVLAMALLGDPELLLLDEPTKGLDSGWKQRLAQLLRKLQKKGTAVLLVSHDIEFCAEFADRVGLLFDGRITSEDMPRKFFSGKSFYTTSANRMARGINREAVLVRDVCYLLGKESVETEQTKEQIPPPLAEMCEKKTEKKPNRLFGCGFLLLFAVAQYCMYRVSSEARKTAAEILGLLCLGGTMMCFFPQKTVWKPKPSPKKKVSFSALFPLLLVLPTVFWGRNAQENYQYYRICLLILAETMAAFFLHFEKRKPSARELVIIAVLCAAAVFGRVAFMPFPQFKPSSAIVFVTGLCLGGESGFLVGTLTGFLSNFFFGQGPWTPWQMLGFGVVGFCGGLMRGKLFRKSRLSIALLGATVVLIGYGGIVNASTALLSGAGMNWKMYFSYCLLGLPYDLIHAASTAYFLWIGAEPLLEKLERVKVKYGLSE